MFLSSPEPKVRNTIFMGPLAHRETSVDAFLNQKKDVKWSEEAENEYLESVKSRATEKVRALLLQAKRRSDEIIHEAELHAQDITSQAEQKAREIEQKAQAELGSAEQRYQDVYNEAVQKAQNDLNQILAQNQQALGESTAVVLLSIHEQLGKFYDVWKEDLKQLTLDAIEVGTGWVASTEKEAILKQLLDESVQKLIDKKNFIVRVNPADAELITQVLENSREKAWSMESSKELEAGSLELESDNVYVKNSHSERQKFVQEILDNLILPKSHDEELLEQQLKNTLNHEMQNNPVLRHSMEQNPEPITEIPLQNIMPNTGQDEMGKNTLANTEPAAQETTFKQAAEQVQTQPAPQPAAQPKPQPKQAQAAPSQADIDDLFDTPQPAPQPAAQPQPQPKQAQAAPSQADIDNLFDSPQENIPQGNVIDDLPTFSSPEVHAEAADMVEEFLGNPQPKPQQQEQEHALPNDLADDLLAEMGFKQ